jgi:hypothetical protein
MPRFLNRRISRSAPDLTSTMRSIHPATAGKNMEVRSEKRKYTNLDT